MGYKIKAHPTMFMGTLYRSRLEARWAAFFHLAGIEYQYEPVDLPGWSPDFRLTWQCKDHKCDQRHSILVEVKPYPRLEDFEGHKCMDFLWGQGDIPADSSAMFGESPKVTQWTIGCRGYFNWWHLEDEFERMTAGKFDNSEVDRLWAEAGNITRWTPKAEKKSNPHPWRRRTNG